MRNISRIAFTLVAGLALALPAHAATRVVEIGAGTFADRCLSQGGLIEAADPTLVCQTAAIEMECHFVAPALAQCQWQGIDNTRAVVRLIGMSNSSSIATGASGGAFKLGGGGGGGINPPDLPLNGGGGGGGIDVPDLPLNNK